MRRMRKALSLLMALIMLTGCGSSLETQKPIVEDAQVIDEQGTHVTDEIEAGGQVTGAQITDTLVTDAQATDPRTVDEQQIVLTIATCGSGRLHMEALDQFNADNNGYQIVVSNYLEQADGNIHVAVTNLIKEIMSGSGPDLIDLSSCPIAYERLCESGALMDLSDYFENDPSISTDQVVDSVMNSLTYQGGFMR